MPASADDKLPWFIAIGASGDQGLDDIKGVLGTFPAGLPMVGLIVLHRAWHRPTYLKDILRLHCLMPVVIATDDELFRPGHIYIGRPEEHLTLAANSLGTMIDDPDRLHRGRTADLLFHSVALHAGSRMIGVVLAGALDDGARGLADIHAAGGYTMVVTPKGPPYGMPENAIRYDGPVSYVGSPSAIGAAICRLVLETNESRKAAGITSIGA